MAITDNDHQGGVIGNEGSSSVQSSNGGQEYGGLSEEVDSIPEQSNNQEIQAIGFNDEGEFAQDTEGGPATPQAENIEGANPTLPSNTRHAVERTDGCIDTIKEATMEEADESDDSSLSELSDANDTSEDPDRTPTLNTNTPAPPTACLPNHIFIAAQGKDYDRQWMVKHNVDAAPLQSFTSKQKLDHLMIHGAVKAGDRLRVTIDHGQGAHDVEGEILDQSKKGRVDVRTGPRRPENDGILYGCSGPKDFVDSMWEEHGRPKHMGNGWRGVRLITSQGQDLGNLYEVRQAHHFWDEQRRLWASSNGMKQPRRRIGKSARPATHLRK